MDQNVQNSAQDVPADQPVEAVVKKHILERRPKTPLEKFKWSLKNYWFIYLCILPGIISMAVYAYGPMFLQIWLSFIDYNFAGGLWHSEFVGFGMFRYIFTEMPDFLTILRNTLWFNVLDTVLGFFPPIILAVVLFHLNSDFFRKFSQTVLYLPHFFSWVIVYSIAYALLSETGAITSILKEVFGYEAEFLTNPNAIVPILYIFSTWKTIGWGSIIYLAAMQNIDTALYEAAEMDGCGPWRRIFVVTLPGIRGVLLYQMIFIIGGIFTGGNTEEILLFYSDATRSRIETINTWLYNYGLGYFEYSPAAALSLVQSVLGMILVLFANRWMKNKYGVSIW